jgi:signal peptidase II
MSLRKAYLLIFIILIVDQVSKIYVKTNFVLGESGSFQMVQNSIH